MLALLTLTCNATKVKYDEKLESTRNKRLVKHCVLCAIDADGWRTH